MSAGGMPVGFEIDDHRPLVLLEQALFLQFLDDGAHLVVVEALAGIGVEGHAEKFVGLLRVLEG